MEGRLKAVQKQQTLWFEELAPAVWYARSELAKIRQSLNRLVKLFESAALAFQQFTAWARTETQGDSIEATGAGGEAPPFCCTRQGGATRRNWSQR